MQVLQLFLNNTWPDLGVNLLGHPLLRRLWYFINTHLNTPDHQVQKLLTPADD